MSVTTNLGPCSIPMLMLLIALTCSTVHSVTTRAQRYAVMRRSGGFVGGHRVDMSSRASDTALEDVFKSFAAFGSAGTADEVALMDSSKFAKLARDLKLLDKKLTATDIDIIFSSPEVKSKTERKITFSQFRVAVQLMADKKYPGDSEGISKLENLITAPQGKSKYTSTSKDTGRGQNEPEYRREMKYMLLREAIQQIAEEEKVQGRESALDDLKDLFVRAILNENRG